MQAGAISIDNSHTMQHIQDGTPGLDVLHRVLPD